MTKTELTKALAEHVDIPRADAAIILDALQTIITESVKKGEPVTITGFVKFARVDRKARMGRNPATGESIKIPAKSAVKATALKGFKEAVMAANQKKSKGAKK